MADISVSNESCTVVWYMYTDLPAADLLHVLPAIRASQLECKAKPNLLEFNNAYSKIKK